MHKFFIFVLVILLGLTLANSFVFAQTAACPGDGSTICLDNPLGKEVNDPNVLIGQVINSIFGVVGSLALIMFIYGGLIWMTSAGSQDKIKKGKDIIVWSVIGLAVIFSAYALVRFVIVNIGA